jgi:hypothetical protein
MNTKFNSFLNEEMTLKELAEDLKDAKYIQVNFIGKGKNWGVTYIKGGKQYEEGSFNTNSDVHNFLVDNEIEYSGKEGYLQMKKYRDKEMAKVPFVSYQQDLLNKGIDSELLF